MASIVAYYSRTNMNSEGSERDALGRLLNEWQVDTKLPPRFQENVWRRIELGQAQEPLWRLVSRRLMELLARPALAASYVTILLVCGLGAGLWQARSANAQADEALSSRYVHLVDPYQASDASR
jgi:hypothetical protein